MHWSIADMLLDLVHNSVQADAGHVRIELRRSDGEMAIRIEDDGKGMDSHQQVLAIDPFYSEPGKHAGRRVGLGLPFLVQTVTTVDGWYRLESEAGRGTTLEIRFNPDHIDCPPMGDVAGMLAAMLTFSGQYELEFHRSVRASDTDTESEYRVSRAELLHALGELETVESRSLLRDFLHSQEAHISSV